MMLAGAALASYLSYKGISSLRTQQKYKQFGDTPKDIVVIHTIQKVGLPLPSPLPWTLKIELLCRMLNIPYQRDFDCPWGPYGKTPWISYNGTHLGDSQRIVEFLLKEFPQNKLNEGIEPEQLAVARSVRIMLEERFFWSMPLWRFIWEEGKSNFYQEFSVLKLPFYFPLPLFRFVLGRTYQGSLWGHGLGRQSKEDILKWTKEDLRTVARILGTKKFITGDKVSVEDAGIFGMLAEAVYGMPSSPYDELIKAELPSIKEYCDRIVAEYSWTDFKS